ncbi:MAG TPA: phytanoyl-CoA dioxygenase family protein [Chloroflexota bacterium]
MTASVDTASAAGLTAAQRERYERDGFLAVPDVFPAAELQELDRELDRLIAIPGNEAGKNRAGWIYAVAGRSDYAARFAEDARLLAMLEELVYPGISIHSSKLVTKLPHSEDVCHWHQDEAFYTKPDDPDTFAARRMSVWVPLQDTDEGNGCLWVVPGSHRWGMEEWTLQQTGTCQRRLNRLAYANEHAVPLPVRGGTVVLFSAWTWHHSKENQADSIRRAFIVSYQEATVAHGAGDQGKVLRPAPASG